MAASAARTEYYVVGSSLSGRNLYRGTELSGVESVLSEWEPLSGEHEFTAALRVARSAAGPAGVVILVTDRQIKDLPFDARLLAVGRAIANVGFSGLEVREEAGVAKWRALIRNFGESPAERNWFVAAGAQRSPAQSIKLEAGEIRVLEGSFPEKAERVSLRLDPDEFAVDDVLPILRPEPRVLFINNQVSPRLATLTGKVIESIDAARAPEPSGPPADLIFVSYDPWNPSVPAANAVVFVDRDPKVGKPVAGRILVEEQELVSHLNWEALIHQAGPGIPQSSNDTVLIWREDKPLLQYRQSPDGTRQLLFGFDVASSNALQLPSFVLAINRFAESIRANKPALERRVLETGQPLRLPVNPAGGAVEIRFVSWDGTEDRRREIALADLPQARAPLRSGYLAIAQDGNPLLQGTTYFADAREGDFRKAASLDGVAGVEMTLAQRNTEIDMNWPLWTLLALALLLGSWGWMAWRRGLVESGGGGLIVEP